MSSKIALFGGTFNPIHLGHIALAKNVYHCFKLDELCFIPSKIPPHKEITCGVTPQNRYDMVKLAVDWLGDGFTVSDFEQALPGKSFTYNTLVHWRELFPAAKLFFLAGSDIFATIETWHNWEKLFDLVNFIVVNRGSTSFEKLRGLIPSTLLNRVIHFTKYNDDKYGKIIFYNMPPIDVSSTMLRSGSCFKNLHLLPSVCSYIKEHSLYNQVR